MIVSDMTDPEVLEHIEVTKSVIADLGASDKPTLLVFNKCDLLSGRNEISAGGDKVFVSGASGDGIDSLLDAIENIILSFKKKYSILLPYSEQSLLNFIYTNYSVDTVDYVAEGVSVVATLDERGAGTLAKYIITE